MKAQTIKLSSFSFGGTASYEFEFCLGEQLVPWVMIMATMPHAPTLAWADSFNCHLPQVYYKDQLPILLEYLRLYWTIVVPLSLHAIWLSMEEMEDQKRHR